MNPGRVLLTGLLLLSLPLLAAPEQAWKNNRLIPLQKVTVGPWDNFEPTVAANDLEIYFTRDRQQIPNIYHQDLSSIQTQRLIGEQGDAKHPQLSPDASRLAFIYFGHDAQGDLCIQILAESDFQCVTDQSSSDSAPFWINNGEVGYLRRERGELGHSLLRYHLKSGEHSSIYRGSIAAPSATPDGRYIIFNMMNKQGEISLNAWDLQQEKLLQPSHLELPGISGTHTLSRDGEYLYFSHYLNDTNGDQLIDGNDHSVLFRVPFASWLNSRASLLPEQLTTVDQNCKFPALSDNHLYITCAFEGSLDIYRLPLAGMVPQDWSRDKVEEAHLIARSHEERLLLLNTLRYRFNQHGEEMLERLLSNHLEVGELTAADYYLDQLMDSYRSMSPELTLFYQTLKRLFEVRSSKHRVAVGVVTARFTRQLEQIRSEILANSLPDSIRHYTNGFLDMELDKPLTALSALEQIDLNGTLLPLERYLVFRLMQRLLGEEDPVRLLQLYPAMLRADNISPESQIHYAYSYLQWLEQSSKDRQQRKSALIDIIAVGVPKRVESLLKTEIAIIALLSAKSEEDQKQAFMVLSKQLKGQTDDIYLRKAGHIRAIVQLGSADHFRYMELLSRHWLITTNISEMEFINTAEQYSAITMDKAYGMLSQQQPLKAYNTFYSAIRQTNDLEAHFQFLSLGLNPDLNRKENMEKAYQLFDKQDLIGDKRLYARALRKVFTAMELNDSKKSETLWQEALQLLQGVEFSGLGISLTDLLSGFIHHQRLLSSKQGYHYDQQAYQKAHYHYMMALDLGRDNRRITASIYENLAWLQFDIGQYGYSADLFSQRLRLPFPNRMGEINLRLSYARALFYTNDYRKASIQAEEVLRLARLEPELKTAPFLEKAAFYALQAELYSPAIRHYKSLLEGELLGQDHNRAKALLGYGFSLIQKGSEKAAIEIMSELVTLSKKLSPLPANQHRLLAQHPLRYQLLAHAFLSQIQGETQTKLSHLQQRIDLLDGLKGQAEVLGYREKTRLALLAKDYLRLALLYETLGDKAELVKSTLEAQQIAELWVEESGDAIGPVLYQTLINALSLGIQYYDHFREIDSALLSVAVDRALQTFAKTPLRTQTMLFQQTKLQLLWSSFQYRVTKVNSLESLALRLQTIMDRSGLAELRETAQEEYRELNEMVATLQGL